MKSEFNDYKINNPDGVDKTYYGLRKVSFSNDTSRFVKENPVAEQSEWKDSVAEASNESEGNKKGKNAAVSSSVGATSVVSAVSGGTGAVVGSVAASLTTAALVVAVFVSILTVNMVLVMANAYSLVFKVELSGVQEGNFYTPIIAVLEDEEGLLYEQEIFSDAVYISFDDLESGKEYTLTVKNEEKVLFRQSYFTAAEQDRQGYIYAGREEEEVFVSVEMVETEQSEWYTVVATDRKGNVIFSAVDDKPNGEFVFSAPEQTDIYFTLSVGGKVIAFYQMEQWYGSDDRYNGRDPYYDDDYGNDYDGDYDDDYDNYDEYANDYNN